MILDKKHALQQKLFRQFAETEFTKELQDELDLTGEFNWEMHKKWLATASWEQRFRQNTAEPAVTACPMY